MVQHETFHGYHEDWARRAAAPYVHFEPEQSAFNLTTPHLVAIFDGRRVPENWLGDYRTKELERLLFVEREIIGRRLRTSAFGYGHTKVNLVKSPSGKLRPERGIGSLRSSLTSLVGGDS
jgi:hypothetical protein